MDRVSDARRDRTHVAANADAARFYERAGLAVDRIDRAPTGDRRRDIVWRIRR